MPKLTDRERRWWAILLDAEFLANKGDMAAINVGNRARYALVKEFGLNLDTICGDAHDEFLKLLTEEQGKLQAEADQRKKTQELLDSLPLRLR